MKTFALSLLLMLAGCGDDDTKSVSIGGWGGGSVSIAKADFEGKSYIIFKSPNGGLFVLENKPDAEKSK